MVHVLTESRRNLGKLACSLLIEGGLFVPLYFPQGTLAVSQDVMYVCANFPVETTIVLALPMGVQLNCCKFVWQFLT